MIMLYSNFDDTDYIYQRGLFCINVDVVGYLIHNKVSGVVLCYTHHKEQHTSLNF